MKPSAFRIERLLAKVEAEVVPPRRPWLQVIIDGDDEVAEAKKRQQALVEHVACHPEDAGRTVEDFNWIQVTIRHPSVAANGGTILADCRPEDKLELRELARGLPARRVNSAGEILPWLNHEE